MERKLKILLDYSSKIANEKDLRNVLLFLTDLAKEIMEADRCSIFLYDDQKKLYGLLLPTVLTGLR